MKPPPRPMSAHEADLVSTVISTIQRLGSRASRAFGADEEKALTELQMAHGDLYRVQEALDAAIEALETERPEDEIEEAS